MPVDTAFIALCFGGMEPKQKRKRISIKLKLSLIFKGSLRQPSSLQKSNYTITIILSIFFNKIGLQKFRYFLSKKNIPDQDLKQYRWQEPLVFVSPKYLPPNRAENNRRERCVGY